MEELVVERILTWNEEDTSLRDPWLYLLIRKGDTYVCHDTTCFLATREKNGEYKVFLKQREGKALKEPVTLDDVLWFTSSELTRISV